MKIDNATVAVLKNFAKINPSILVKEGNVLKTVSPSKTIMAKATVSTKFSRQFAIYNLDRFISTISLFNEPELNFNDNSVSITDGNRNTNYFYADESIIDQKISDKNINLPSTDVKFTLTEANMKDVERALGVLGLPEIVVSGENGKILLQAADTKNPSSDVYSIEIGKTDKNFKAIFKSENIRIIPGDYEVSVCSQGISHFVGKQAEYWIAVEQKSTFN